MGDARNPRFESAEGALRFYFRAKALFADAEPICERSQRLRRGDVVADYLALASCLKRLDAVQIGLLKALYGPTCFGMPPRTVRRASTAVRRQLGNHDLSSRGADRLRHETLKLVARALAQRHLIDRSANQGFNQPRRTTRAASAHRMSRRAHR
jgi:hypothetical protein